MYKDKDFTGIWTPVEVLRLTNIGTTQKYILSIITALDRNNEGCYASNKYFAEMMQITPGRVSEIISELHQKELLTYEVDQTANHIRIIRPRIDIKVKPLDPMGKTAEPIRENPNNSKGKTAEAIRENPKHNNKDYNKEDNKKDERELSHFSYVLKSFPNEFQEWNEMYGKKIPRKREFSTAFDSRMQLEKRSKDKFLIPRLTEYSRHWVNNLKESDKPPPIMPWMKKIS